MIIKLFEQPIIAINEAEIAGTVDGVIIKGKNISCFYHENMDNRFTVSVDKAIIGADALMIQDMTVMSPVSRSVKPLRALTDVFNTSGDNLGCLHKLEVDDDYTVRYIYTEEYKIDIGRVISYDRVVVADMDAKVAETPEKSTVEAVQDVIMDMEPDIKWNEENAKPLETVHDSSEMGVVRTIFPTEEKTDNPEVDPKYAYLCGKKLLENIEIEETLYEKGTVIAASLIKHAIANNAIVTVIVNAEE
ncbi:MAG TPA: hypothetical protein VN549_07175 [Negativicutes bacterium]|nr:hypothetical protein [Negativicutes bacterium]